MQFSVVAIVVLAATSCALTFRSATCGSVGEPQDRHQINVPKVFNFDLYRQMYKRHYSSVIEETVRQPIYIARATSVFLAGIAYKTGHKPYYESINLFSDWTKAELDATENPFLMKNLTGTFATNEVADEHKLDAAQNSEFDNLKADEHTVERLAELAEKHRGEPAFDAIRRELEPGQRRRKRGADNLETPVRELTDDMLMPSPDRPVEVTPEVKSKRVVKSKYANPNHEPIEHVSFGLGDQLVEVPLAPQEIPISYLNSRKFLMKKLRSFIKEVQPPDANIDSGAQVNGDDVVYVDLRETGCLLPSRNQGQCGSCFIFVAITMLEFLHCMKTDEAIAFSEQYVIDCGSAYSLAGGCRGGHIGQVANFVHNFGVELHRDYPYNARENECPLPEHIDKEQTGYLRLNVEHWHLLLISEWASVLTETPIYVAIYTKSGFRSYGGGIFDPDMCDPNATTHAVLLVGHGRADGLEYWIIRNSHGQHWGENGYMKLSKRSNCLDATGYIFGSSRGKTHRKFKINNASYLGLERKVAASPNWQLIRGALKSVESSNKV